MAAALGAISQGPPTVELQSEPNAPCICFGSNAIATNPNVQIDRSIGRSSPRGLQATTIYCIATTSVGTSASASNRTTSKRANVRGARTSKAVFAASFAAIGSCTRPFESV